MITFRFRNPFRKRWQVVGNYEAIGPQPYGRPYWLRSSAALRVARMERYRWAFPPGHLSVVRLP